MDLVFLSINVCLFLFREEARLFVTGKPLSAISIAGRITSRKLSLPYFLCAASNPATDPGTPLASRVSVLNPSMTFPLLSRYMSDVAAMGAFSLKSSVLIAPSEVLITIKPPPPRLPASG